MEQKGKNIGVPKESLLLLFDIYANDPFLTRLDSEICKFAYVNTIFSCGNDLHEIDTILENDLSRFSEWFIKNGMVAKKFQLIFLGLNGQRGMCLNIEENKVSTTDSVRLIGIEIDNNLKFTQHVKALCSKVNKKTSAFSRLNIYISRE